jgi:hypothetical protein
MIRKHLLTNVLKQIFIHFWSNRYKKFDEKRLLLERVRIPIDLLVSIFRSTIPILIKQQQKLQYDQFFVLFQFDCFFTISSLMANLVAGGINWNGKNWAMSCDFHGNDLSNVRSSGELCGQKCARTKDCTHFTWSQHKVGTCWMKSGSVSKDDAFSTSDPNMVCDLLGEHTNQTPPKTPPKTGSKDSAMAKNVKFTYYWIAFEEG